MSDLRDTIFEHLKSGTVVQLATSQDDKPWVCNVYYVVDDQMRLYWLSYSSRRHSQDIAVNPHVAMTVAVKTDIPVIGIQMEGEAEEVRSLKIMARIMPSYIKKYGAGRDFLKNASLYKNKHVLYRMQPQRIVLFDEFQFGHDNAQELISESVK